MNRVRDQRLIPAFVSLGFLRKDFETAMIGMNRAQHFQYAKVADHRGGKRVYLQNLRLESVGFAPSTAYRVELSLGRVRLVASDGGERRVCGRRRGERLIPVIDLSSREIGVALGEAHQVRVIYRQDVIEIDLHPTERAIQERETAFEVSLACGELAIGSICTGLGVIDRAVHEGLSISGVRSRSSFIVELSEAYIDQALVSNPVFSSTQSFCGSIDEIEPRYLPYANVLIAGLPCTGASTSGMAKKGLARPEDDPHVGHLFVAFLEIVKKVNPAVIILENVVPYQSSASMSVIRAVLSRLGYDLREMILEGEAFSLEDRKRFVLVAVSRGLRISKIEVAQHGHAGTIADILEDVPLDSDRWKSAQYLVDKEKRDVLAGKNFRQQIVTPAAKRVGTIGRGYYKWRSTEPRLAHPLVPGLSRLFTPREHAAIKGIDPAMIGGLSDTVAHEMLGQSAVAGMFVALGQAIGSACLERV